MPRKKNKTDCRKLTHIPSPLPRPKELPRHSVALELPLRPPNHLSRLSEQQAVVLKWAFSKSVQSVKKLNWRIRVWTASCVRLSSLAIFFSISRFKSQFGRFGAILNTSYWLINDVNPKKVKKVVNRTSSCARSFSSSARICSASPFTWTSTVSCITTSSLVCFRSVRESGSKFLFFMRGSAFLHNNKKLISIPIHL